MPTPKTGLDSAIFQQKTFSFRTNNLIYIGGRYEPSSPVNLKNDLHDVILEGFASPKRTRKDCFTRCNFVEGHYLRQNMTFEIPVSPVFKMMTENRMS